MPSAREACSAVWQGRSASRVECWLPGSEGARLCLRFALVLAQKEPRMSSFLELFVVCWWEGKMLMTLRKFKQTGWGSKSFLGMWLQLYLFLTGYAISILMWTWPFQGFAFLGGKCMGGILRMTLGSKSSPSREAPQSGCQIRGRAGRIQ